jgi:hypothetical protein
MAEPLAEQLLARLSAMQSERALIEPFYQAASMYFDPLMARYWARTASEKRGPNFNGDLYSGAGIASLSRMTNFLQGNGTPAAAPWLKLQDGAVEGDSDVDQFWADETRALAKDLRGDATTGGSFYLSKRSEYRQMAISYGVVAVYEQEDHGVMTGTVIHEHIPSHAFFYQLDAFGRMKAGAYVRSVSTETLRSLINRSPVDAETDEEKHSKSGDLHSICQMVLMNPNARDIPRSPDEFPFVEYFIDMKDKRILRQAGYRSQMFHIMGWNKVPGSNYFVGPCYEALPDMVSAACARKAQLMAMEWIGTPPLIGGSKIEGAAKTLRPRRITWGAKGVKGEDMITALQSGGNPGALFQQVGDDEARVRTLMSNDEMLSQRRPNMTATEAQIVAGERSAMVAPFAITTIPCIRGQMARHFEIKVRTGQVQDIPRAVLEQGKFDADVVGPLAIAARQAESGSLMTTFEQMAFIEGTPVQRLDKNEAAKMVAENNGHVALLRDMNEVQRDMEAVAAQNQEAVAAEIENTESQTLKNVTDAIGAEAA